MTTPDNRPTANAIAAALSSEEWVALEAVRTSDAKKPETWCNDRLGNSQIWSSLQNKHLIWWDKNDCIVTITDLGLAALATRETPAGEGRPTEISWLDLTPDEQITLKQVAAVIFSSTKIRAELEHKGLIANQWHNLNQVTSIITQSGIAILAEANDIRRTPPQPPTAQAANETAKGSGADEPQTQAELCEREIVKIRSLTLKDDEYTGDLLAYAVGSPVGITMCVEARMKQIADLQSEVERLKKQIKKLKHKSSLDDGFIDHLTQESEE